MKSLLTLAPAALALALWTAPAGAFLPVESRCATPSENLRLATALPRVADRIARGKTLNVVAIGSSSTAGAGASEPGKAYPAVLARALGARLAALKIHVVNAGVNGEITRDMVARFDRDVLAHQPHLVIWQVGANAVLRDRGIDRHELFIRDGIRRLKAAKADVILMDLQYAPRMLADPDHPAMEALLARLAHDEQVGLFRRFAIMRNWVETGRMTESEMVAPDGLHMNDLSYGCVGQLLAQAIVDGAERLTAGR